jgi:hypothetical protein
MANAAQNHTEKRKSLKQIVMAKEKPGVFGFKQELLEAGLKDQPVKVRIVP